MIDYIIKTRMSEIKSHHKPSTTYSGKFRKIKIDDFMFFCKKCSCVWASVAPFIDRIKWRKYPKGNIPSYGKTRKKCPDCEL